MSAARINDDDDSVGMVYVCRGPEKGCTRDPGSPIQGVCENCYAFAADDPRPTDEIIAAMSRGDA